MAAEVIIIIIGAVLIMVAITNLLNMKIRILIGVLGILLIIYGGYSYGNINLLGPLEPVEAGNKITVDSPVQKTQVLSPVAGDSVKCRIITMGVYPQGINKDIWVLLRPSNNKYYPQSDHTNTSYKRNGEWQVITRFGGDKGESYELIVYETDSSASEFFSATINTWKNSESYPGIELQNIPSSAVEVERMTVFLKENCRGVF